MQNFIREQAKKEVYPGFSNLQVVVWGVKDGTIGAAGSDEADPGGVSCQLDGPLCGHGIARVENCRAWDTAEHGKVLQRHLGGTIFSYGGQVITNQVTVQRYFHKIHTNQTGYISTQMCVLFWYTVFKVRRLIPIKLQVNFHQKKNINLIFNCEICSDRIYFKLIENCMTFMVSEWFCIIV